jgi:hypothetical protein
MDDAVDLSHSIKALQRNFEKIGEQQFKVFDKILQFDFMVNKENHDIKGGYYDIDEQTNEKIFKIIFILQFRKQITLNAYPKDIDKRKLLQVEKIITSSRFRDNGLGLFGYQLALKQGFNILSDTTQFDGDKALWKKMARLSQVKDYSIVILDSDRGYKKDTKGSIIEYDGTNVHDDDIWTYGQDYSVEDILLFMRNK